MSLRNFEIISMLGKGGYGDVTLAKCKKNDNGIIKNQLVAIKIIHKRNASSIIKEIEILRVVKNTMFLSQMLMTFQDRTHVFIVLRFEENGSLFDYLQKMTKIPIDSAQKIIVEIILGLRFLHLKNFVHGDLKPENILLDSNLRAHVGDFGLSSKLQNNRKFYGKWGTLGYQSPEQLLENVPWDQRIDYFICGIIFVQMITGKHPFGTSYSEINENTVALRFKMPQLESNAPTSFIKKTLCLQENRLDDATIIKHEFVEPLIENLTIFYDWNYTTILEQDSQIPPYFDNMNFLPIIANVPYDGVLWNGNASKSSIKSPKEMNINIDNGEKSPKPLNEENAAREHSKENKAPNRQRKRKARIESNGRKDTCPSGNRVINILMNQLANKQTTHREVTKESIDTYRIACQSCAEKIKAKVQKRGKKTLKRNWSVQPFERHIATHHKKRN